MRFIAIAIAIAPCTSFPSPRAPRRHHPAPLINVALCATSPLPCAPHHHHPVHRIPIALLPSRNTDEVPSTMTASSSKHKLCSMHGNKGSTTKRSCVSSVKEHTPPAMRLADLGGIDPCMENMLEFISMPLTHPKVYLHTGVQPPHGVLLHGLPGCGKMMLTNAIGGVGPLPPPSFFFCVGMQINKIKKGGGF